jgi:galactose-1-phosphate uridylyltransferase
LQDYFITEFTETRILDFADRFREKTVPIEVRTDRFTERVSRILPFRMKLPEPSHPLALIEEATQTCPFCPERLESGTPMFPEEIIEGGRLRYGASVVIPNAFPYCRFCGVTIFAPDHYIPMDKITDTVLCDPVEASLRWFDRLYEYDSSITYYSINWNYLPTAGGSLFHPHFQVVADPAPTNFHSRLISSATAYRTVRGSCYWEDLIAFEEKQGKRDLFRLGDVVFLASFSPGGIFGEVLVLFREKTALGAVTDSDWQDFIAGLARILRCFSRLNLDCLNMTLLLSRRGDADTWVQARIMPRVLIPPWGTSDVNYFEKGHEEKVVVFPPESLAEEIRKTQ